MDDPRWLPTSVPDAPYKKTWYELGWKRHFMEALRDPSIERLTWTTGDVQTDRYDLSKHIDRVHARTPMVARIENLGNGKFLVSNASGIRSLFNTLEEAQEDVRKSRENMGNKVFLDVWVGGMDNPQTLNIRLDDLPLHIGKELADKIYNDIDWSSGTGSSQNYEGLDLKVGGEFHKQLYDKKIPQFVKKFLKRFGVEPKKWQADSDTGYVIDDEGNEFYIGSGVNIWQVGQGPDAEDILLERLSSNEEAHEALRKYGKLDESPYSVWYIDITPEMRETYAEGVPLAMREDEEGLLGRYA